MNYKLHSLVAATLAGSLLMGFGVNAMADSTFDLVQALVAKGVLTEEEAIPLMKGRENDITLADKKVKKAAKIGISDAIDNATLYGDMRARYEQREGKGVGTTAGVNVDANRDRARYKLTFGVKTTADDFYTDIAFAMGAGGRSDNATFGSTTNAASGGSAYNDKQSLLVKRAMIGWNATDWLALEVGRIDNPLYTTPMVWDADLQFQGLAEKFKYSTLSKTDLFFTAAQAEYLGDKRSFPDGGGSRTATNELLAFQGGFKMPLNDNSSAKAALTYTTFTHGTAKSTGVYNPGSSTQTVTTLLAPAAGPANTLSSSTTAVNDLKTIEIPGEINYMISSNIGIRLFGDYVYNIDGGDRKDSACGAASRALPLANANNIAVKNAVCNGGTDDDAWMLGLAIGSAADLKAFEGNKLVKGDWAARIWYQDVGAYAVDPNAVDSDFNDSRVNMKGVVFKAQYNLRDNVFVNFAAGHAKRKNNDLGTAATGNDLALNLKDFNLYQLDLTYKF